LNTPLRLSSHNSLTSFHCSSEATAAASAATAAQLEEQQENNTSSTATTTAATAPKCSWRGCWMLPSSHNNLTPSLCSSETMTSAATAAAWKIKATTTQQANSWGGC
jgi:hypothetical protein